MALEARLDQLVDLPAATAARMVAPYTWLLSRVGDTGITLTKAGYLPPSVVEEAMAALGDRVDWIGKANREDLTVPVLHFRESAQRMRLVRKLKGRLVLSPAGRRLRDDPVALAGHLVDSLLEDPDASQPDAVRQAACLLLLATAAGRPVQKRATGPFLAAYLTYAGWTRGGRDPLTPSESSSLARDAEDVLVYLGAIRSGLWSDPAGPATDDGVLLARYALGRPAVAPPDAPGTPTAGTASTYVLRVELTGSDPLVWRRITVPGDLTLSQLHEVLQAALGWEDYHLFRFRVGERRFMEASDWDDGTELITDPDSVTLQEVMPAVGAFEYEYDFGDSWQHGLVVESIEQDDFRAQPRCTDGANACPPEDVGGIGGYAEFLEALDDPEHEQHDSMLEWTGGPFDAAAFDRAASSERLRIASALM